ncbi:hypothetical protein D3C71_1377880 [compost metagenome]
MCWNRRRVRGACSRSSCRPPPITACCRVRQQQERQRQPREASSPRRCRHRRKPWLCPLRKPKRRSRTTAIIWSRATRCCSSSRMTGSSRTSCSIWRTAGASRRWLRCVGIPVSRWPNPICRMQSFWTSSCPLWTDGRFSGSSRRRQIPGIFRFTSYRLMMK